MAFEPSIYVVEQIGAGLLTIMARPVPEEWTDEMFAGLAEWGVHRIVLPHGPLLENESVSGDMEALCTRHGIQFLSFPMNDRGVPSSLPDFRTCTHMLYETTGRGTNTVVYSRAGIGSEELMVAGVLAHAGFEPKKAFRHISKARGTAVQEGKEQRNWLVKHWREFLGLWPD
ncbi:MAG TPA: hypothetical protein VLE43_10095 [Candidatus Saccharimonadia bacterium]|nr:hypothetical protein [Candidatus Saccharimonadia bacterium]